MKEKTLQEIQERIKIIESRDITTWPYAGEGSIDENYRKGFNLWTEVTEEHYWNQLECVPPRKFDGNAFMVGEQYTTDDIGSVYTVFISVGERVFGKMSYVKDFDLFKYREQIRLQFSF